MHDGKYLPLVGIFLFFILLLVIGSLGVRTFSVLQSSKFDTHHQFLIGFNGDKENPGVVALSPDTSSLTFVTFRHGGDVLDTIPVDVKLSTSMPTTEELPDSFRGHIFSPSGGLTWFDELQLWWFSNNIRPKNITTTTYSLPADQDEMNRNLPTLLRDNTLYTQASSIAIINASDMSGVGNDLAKRITSIGGNVISVTTADAPQSSTTITYTGAYAYSVKRMEQIMHTKATADTQHTRIADITITIGEKR